VKNGEYGPVQRGQTLSAVARDVAPGGVNIDQMMLALKQANPDAFYRDNINALKAGAVLRVPTRDEALAMKVAEAAAAVRRQNGDWSAGAARTPTAVAAAATRDNASASPSGNAGGGDRLALVPAGDGGQGAGSGGKQGSAGLRQQLQRSQEALSSLQQQSADLNSRLKDLEDLNSKNQRLLSLKDNQIAELQAKLAAARKAAGLPPAKPETPSAAAPADAASSVTGPLAAAVSPHAADAVPAQVATAASATAARTTTAAPVSAATASVAPAAMAPKPAARPVVKKPVAHRHPAPAPEQPWYMQGWAMIAGAAVVVLGLLLLLASRGRRGKPAPAAVKTAPSLADRFGDAPVPAAAGSADPDQDELLDQLAEHPDDVGLHLELVSLYYSRRDVEHFEAAAEAMHAHITSPDQDEWQDVVHMGEDLTPGHPLFARADAAPGHADGAALPATEDERQALDEFDLDSYADEASTGPTPPPLRQKVSEYHFDFNLTPQQAHAKAAEEAGHAEPAPAVAASDDETVVSSWNFEEPAPAAAATAAGDDFGDFGELNDDPIDTKLDLARAYLDMGDPDGARAMLDEVMQEGSQMQRDVAKGLLDKLA
jgi:pilus assembly protein FimV